MKTEHYHVITITYLSSRNLQTLNSHELWEGYFSFFPDKEQIKEAIKIWDGVNKIPSSLYAKLIAVVDCWSIISDCPNREVIEVSGLNYSIQHNEELVFTS